MMRTIFIGLLVACGIRANSQQLFKIASPNGRLQVRLNMGKTGALSYSVLLDHQIVIHPSTLGFKIKDKPLLVDQLVIQKIDSNSVNEQWQPVLGEVKNIINAYKSIRITTFHPPSQITIGFEFRVFDDGIGFRYFFPNTGKPQHYVIEKEWSHFSVQTNAEAWWLPGDFDSQEYPYNHSTLSDINADRALEAHKINTSSRAIIAPNAVQVPLLMHTKDVWVHINEAALIDYPAFHLTLNKSNFSFSTLLTPDALGNAAYIETPFNTPWRVLIISHQASDIANSKIILNLNEPCKIANTSWIKPKKYVGIWWEMHIGKSTWNYSNASDSKGLSATQATHGATTANAKRYIDFAAQQGLDAVLIEGWNKGWEDWVFTWKEDVFDFITPYPDFDMMEVSRYAKEKKVSIITHHETAGAVASYERNMDTAFRQLKKLGSDAIKTGYVANEKMVPRGEAHDGQYMVNHYNRVIQKAASYGILVDAHEPVRPTGIQRTYPNFLACEAARGNEFCNTEYGNPPSHETILPFTRLLGGPMDYTPGIFNANLSIYHSNRLGRVHTTLAKQLALYVTMYSPLQMAADLPENYEAHLDAFQFIKDVPLDWDDTKYLEAAPGQYLTIARKQKNESNWFLGAITNERKRTTTILFSFLETGKKYEATVYEDASNADWKTNPSAYNIRKLVVDKNTALTLSLAPGGGAAIALKVQ